MPVHTVYVKDELSDSETLWRYMKLSTLLLLLEGKAFFPSVTKLRSGDPLEGILYADAPWLAAKITDEEEEWLWEHADKTEKRSLELSKDNPPYYSRALVELYVRELLQRRAAWCWFRSPIESAAMWSIYGHAGMAVKTTLGALKKALPEDRPFQIADIRYAKRYPNERDWFNPESNEAFIHRPHLVKSAEYGHEKELRVVTACLPGTNGELVRGLDWNELVQTVVISPLFPYEEAKAIEQCLVRHDWKSQPYIRRSELLGDAVEDEESAAAVRERSRAYFGDVNEETGLPPLMREL